MPCGIEEDPKREGVSQSPEGVAGALPATRQSPHHIAASQASHSSPKNSHHPVQQGVLAGPGEGTLQCARFSSKGSGRQRDPGTSHRESRQQTLSRTKSWEPATESKLTGLLNSNTRSSSHSERGWVGPGESKRKGSPPSRIQPGAHGGSWDRWPELRLRLLQAGSKALRRGAPRSACEDFSCLG